jgi:hypothetical protein
LGQFNSWPEPFKAGALLLSGIACWLLLLTSVYFFAPTVLITLRNGIDREVPDSAGKVLDKVTFGAFALLRWFGILLLLDLSSSPRVLNHWVRKRLDIALASFDGHRIVQERMVTVDLPVRINGNLQTQPWTDVGKPTRQPSFKLLIAGPGGVGKTTLACWIARQLALSDSTIPLLVETDLPAESKQEEFGNQMGGLLRAAIRQDSEIPSWLIEKLLRTGRLVVVLDGLSERSTETARAFNPTRPGFPIARLIVTSRDLNEPGMETVLEPAGISGGPALVAFVSEYLKKTSVIDTRIRVPEEPIILDSCAKLLRLLRGKVVTPLLASIWASQLGRIANTDNGNSENFSGVADLFDGYVLLLLRTASGGSETLLQRLLADAIAIAVTELGGKYRPGFITRGAALAAISLCSPADPDKRMRLLEESRLLEAASIDRDAVRIEPDTIAEHLVARNRVEMLGRCEGDWEAFVGELEAAGWPAEFVEALSSCAQSQAYGRPVPDRIRVLLSDRSKQTSETAPPLGFLREGLGL